MQEFTKEFIENLSDEYLKGLRKEFQEKLLKDFLKDVSYNIERFFGEFIKKNARDRIFEGNPEKSY